MRNEANLPAVVAQLGRDLIIDERRAAAALLAWLRSGRAEDHEGLRSALERRRMLEANLRRNLSALARSQGGAYSLRLERDIRWDARSAYLDAMGLRRPAPAAEDYRAADGPERGAA